MFYARWFEVMTLLTAYKLLYFFMSALQFLSIGRYCCFCSVRLLWLATMYPPVHKNYLLHWFSLLLLSPLLHFITSQLSRTTSGWCAAVMKVLSFARSCVCVCFTWCLLGHGKEQCSLFLFYALVVSTAPFIDVTQAGLFLRMYLIHIHWCLTDTLNYASVSSGASPDYGAFLLDASREK